MEQQPLTKIQTRVLSFIRNEIRSTGRPPSIREIQAEFGYRSPHTAQFHVNNLISAGHLRRGSGHRGLQLIESSKGLEQIALQCGRGKPPLLIVGGAATSQVPNTVMKFALRLAGTVAAGYPIEAIEQQDEYIQLGVFSSENHFALRVRGESMIDECIADGDHVVVRKQTTCADGDLVVARIGEEATLKRFHHEPRKRRIRLQPANSTMKPIFCRPEDLTIEGVVVGVVRLMSGGK